ncbi:MAG TPA: glycosyltransferase family 2 protein [Vicinamibacteria bacterium]|nr:glycosyltransferase family 2 protein [Vicinamibacteria bacterium]
MTPEVSAVVVAYRTAGLLPRCLDALDAAAGGLALERIVVDNASGDGTAALVGARAGVRLVSNDTNRGFAAAANQGARVASGRFVLFLNPDARPAPGSLEALVAALRATPEAGLASPRLVWPDGTPQPSAWLAPSLATLAFEALRLWNLRPRSRLDHLESIQGPPFAVPCVCGACLLARPACFDALGGFDERFFLYHEDWDLCLRARVAGWSCLLVPEASAVHERGGSAFQDRADFWRRYTESRDLLIRRHFRGARRPPALLLHRLGLRAQAFAFRVAGRPEESRHVSAARRALPSLTARSRGC